MRKINKFENHKVWGNEVFLNSPLVAHQTTFEDNNELTTEGPIIKLMLTNQPTSIHVHPSKSIAQIIEDKPSGKNEAWIVLNKSEGSKIVYGSSTVDKQIVRNAVETKTLDKLLNVIEPQIGYFYNIPAGLIHAVGYHKDDKVDMLVIENAVDSTYRLYDYNRKWDGKKRDLHIEKSLISLKRESAESQIDFMNENIKVCYMNDYQIYAVKNSSLSFDKTAWIVHKDSYDTYLVESGENILDFSGWIIIERSKC